MSKEILQKLLESDVLTEETRNSIQVAFDAVIAEATEQTRADVTATLTAEYAAEFAKEREALIESVDTLVNTMVEKYVAESAASIATHIAENKADIERFRDLEAEHAQRLVEAEEKLAESTRNDLKTLIEKLDDFIDKAVTAEFAEIREDLVESQRNAMGAKIFEGFRKEFEQYYLQSTGVAGQVDKLSAELKSAQTQNAELQESLQAIQRTQTMTTVLSPLTGQPRKVMETILATVATDKLQETYERFIDRVIKEADTTSAQGTPSEKENPEVLAESKVDPKTVVMKTGDSEPVSNRKVVTESKAGMGDEDKRRLLRAAGVM